MIVAPVDTLSTVWDTGVVALTNTLAPLLSSLPAGWATLLQVRLYAEGTWAFAGVSGVEVPGPDGVWFTLGSVDCHRTVDGLNGLLVRRLDGPLTLSYIIQGRRRA